MVDYMEFIVESNKMDRETTIKSVSIGYVRPDGTEISFDIQYINDMDHTIMMQRVITDESGKMKLSVLLESLIIPIKSSIRDMVCTDVEYMPRDVYMKLQNKVFTALKEIDKRINQDFKSYLAYGYYTDLTITYSDCLDESILLSNHKMESCMLSDIMMVFAPVQYSDTVRDIISGVLEPTSGLAYLCNIARKYIYQYYTLENEGVKPEAKTNADGTSVIRQVDGELIKNEEVDKVISQRNRTMSGYATQTDSADKNTAQLLYENAVSHSPTGTLDGINAHVSNQEVKDRKIQGVRAQLAQHKNKNKS